MTILDSIILGAVQGLTEFLPVSSSGHLEIGSLLLGLKGEDNLQFSVALHGGTVLSTLVVFWKDIVNLFRGFFRFEMNEETKFLLRIAVSLIPIMIVGLTCKDLVEGLFTGNLWIVGSMLLLTALLLWTSSRKVSVPNYRPKKFTYWRAFVIGIAQAVAVLPGLSRSGSTISTGLLLGVDRTQMAKFSFLMVLVPIIGANLLEVMDGEFTALPKSEIAPLVTGFLTSFIVGALACKWMVKLVSKGNLKWFALYCLVVGLIALTAACIR